MKKIYKSVKTKEEADELEKDGYTLDTMTYWEDTPDSFSFNMVKLVESDDDESEEE